MHSSPHPSRGVVPRLRNLRDARQHATQVNHIVGDVHYLALGLPPGRTVLTIHDCASLERLKGWRRLLFKWLWFELPVRRSAIVTTISESARRELQQHVHCGAKPLRVIYNCVSRDFVPSAKPFNNFQPTILQVGTAWNKNVERVAAALVGLNCRLQIVGKLSSGQIQTLVRHQVAYQNTARATDAEMLEAYRACDLLVFASTYEGFGMPILEAQATGRPVVTGNLLSMPEIAGKAACLVDPFDAEAIRSGVLRVWHHAEYRERLVEAGLANARRFAPATTAAAYAELYREIVANARNPNS